MNNSDNFKTRVVKCCDMSLTQLRVKMREYMGTTKLQSYFPILDNYFDFYNGSKCDFTLKTRYRITDLLNKKEHTIDDSYIKNFITCRIKDVSSGREDIKEIFIKTLPLLNVTHYLTNKYSLEPKSSILSDSYFRETIEKINNPNNSAYIDVFFSYLGSRLTESGKCPTFPLFYGTYSGIMDEFKIDISEDYEDLKDDDDFIYLLGNLFNLEDAKIEQEPLINTDLLNNECVIEIDSLDSLSDTSSINEVSEDEAGAEAEAEVSEAGAEAEVSEAGAEAEAEVSEAEAEASEASEASEAEAEVSNLNLEHEELNVNLNIDFDKLSLDSVESNSERNNMHEAGIWEDIDSLNEKSDNDELGIEQILRDNSDIKILESDCSFSDISDISTKSNSLKYAKIPNFPVQFNFIETLDGTLDNYIDNSINKKIPVVEWKSILFQICFGLAVAQKQFLFVHNDLHSSNIMFKNTEKEYIYFKFTNKYYRIPTFGKISKIIDFGRATFKLGNKIYFSDVFMHNEDAWGQYTYPKNNSLKNCKIKPNMSFDLSRFATTIIERFELCDDTYKDIKNLLNLWMTDKFGNDISELEEDFDLYKLIARNVKSAQPKSQLYKKIWNEFLIEKDDIPTSEFIYKF